MGKVVSPEADIFVEQVVPYRTVERQPGLRAITLNVPQGIGDIFWVYQKFVPYFDVINFNVLVTRPDLVQLRAGDWLTLLPQVGDISFRVVTDQRYQAVIGQNYDMAVILASCRPYVKEFDYACNRPLEEGRRLDEIDPGCEVATDLPVTVHECPLAFPAYAAAYVSGGTKDMSTVEGGAWSVEKWADMFYRLYGQHGVRLPIIFVGASYDREVEKDLSDRLSRLQVPNLVYTDSYPANVCYILKNARFFVGYQSGLNILADNFDTPQLMLYYDSLQKMRYAWCKRKNVNTVFRAALFSDRPDQVARAFALFLHEIDAAERRQVHAS